MKALSNFPNLEVNIMKKGKLFLATAFIPVMTGTALYFSSNTASAATPGWYDPMPWGSNVECRKGYAYGPKNLNNGKCRFNFQGAFNYAVGRLTTGWINGR